jgi:hypothetical protein
MLRLVCCLALTSFACSDDPDPHEIGACVGWTDNLGNAFTGQCEAACKMPPSATGDSCDTTKQLNCRELTFGGTDGCCLEDAGDIKFFECIP